jgi:hypothetical protein
MKTYPSTGTRLTRVFGISLIIVGGTLMLGQALDMDLGNLLWPFLVIVPGLLLFALGGESASGAAGALIPACIVITTGLLLLYQTATGHWESWAYAWALVVPTSLGIGLILYGRRTGQPAAREVGEGLTRFGLAVFLAAGIFFDMILRIGETSAGGLFWPLALMVTGAYLLTRRLRRAPRRVVAGVPDPSSLTEVVSDSGALSSPGENSAGQP